MTRAELIAALKIETMAILNALAALDALPADPTPARGEVVEQAHSYLARLLQNTRPQCEPLPDLWGLCTQIDNMVTEIPKLRAEVKRLRKTLEWYADHTRYNGFNLHQATNDAGYRARAALVKDPGNEG